MLARLQRLLVLLALASAGAWGTWAVTHGVGLGWTLAGLLLALAPHAPVLALEFVLLATLGRDPQAPRATPAQLLRAWWGEVRCGWQVFGWRQPFAADQVPDTPGPPDSSETPDTPETPETPDTPDTPHRPGQPATGGRPATPGRTGVLLLHGYVCNRGIWSPWLRRLQQQGVPCTALTLEPVFGRIDTWVPAIEAAVADLQRRTGRPPLLVGHSMGGLAVRAWLAAQPDAARADARVLGVVTIGTPHHGTWAARFGLSANACQMRQNSPWLATLAAAESARRRALFTCFYGHADNIVFPASTATLAGADNRHVPGAAHVQMVFEPMVINEVLRRVG